MPRLGWETMEYLAETVASDDAPRTDRLFALERLLAEGSGAARFLERIGSACRDPFFRRVAILESRRWALLEASREGLGQHRAMEFLAP